MNSKVYKCCAVPMCKSTSISTPDKLFVYVPQKKTIRVKWLKLARRYPDSVGENSPLYFCEDHFDLPNDMENYMEYHIMGSVAQVRMNRGCLPKKFACQTDRKPEVSEKKQHPYLAWKDKTMIIEGEKQFQGRRREYLKSVKAASRVSASTQCDETLAGDLPNMSDCGNTTAIAANRISVPVSDSPYIVETDVKIEFSESDPLHNIVMPEGKELIVRVYRYLEREYEQLKQLGHSCDLSGLANILKRTAAATGLAEHAVTSILEAAGSDSDTVTGNNSDADDEDPTTNEEDSSRFTNCTTVPEDSSVDNNFILLYENEIKMESETVRGELADIMIESVAEHETADTTHITVKREPAELDPRVTDPLHAQKHRLDVIRVYSNDVTPAVVKSVIRKRKSGSPPD